MAVSSRIDTRYATVRPLSPRGRKTEESVEQLAAALAGSGEAGRLQLTIRGGDKARQFSVELARNKASSQARKVSNPDLEVVVHESTWWEIVEGRLSPPDAFRRGKMRIRGDVHLGSRLYKFLAADDGSTELCLG
jgi:putative sterol carrier protein